MRKYLNTMTWPCNRTPPEFFRNKLTKAIRYQVGSIALIKAFSRSNAKPVQIDEI